MKPFPVCKRSELAGGIVKTVRLLGRSVAVFEHEGTIKAVDGLCRHMNMPLFQAGKIEGPVLTCPFHGWQYDTRTFECIGKPGVRLREYQLIIEGDRVLVTLDTAEMP